MAPIPYFNSSGEVLPLSTLMRLHKIDDNNYKSHAKAYAPTGGANGAYGGYIYSLSAWAAAQTVNPGLLIHSVSGSFILGGIPDEHFFLEVTRIRDGGRYSTRYVTATQSKGVCFTAMVSFKRSEASTVEMQESVDLHKEFASVLDGKKSHFDHPESPSQGSEWFVQDYLPKHPEHYNPLPGLHLRQVDMQAYNADRDVADRRSLAFYSLRGRLPKLPSRGQHLHELDLNLHIIAHLFASDRNSLFVIPRHLGLGRELARTASLSHTVIFHAPLEQMLMADEPRGRNAKSPPTEPVKGEDWSGEADESARKWYVQEAWMTRAGGGRGLHHSRLWDAETGVHIATTIQDGMVRFKAKDGDREAKM